MNRIYFFFFLFFSSAQLLLSQTPEQIRAMLPEIPGWTISDNIEVFDSNTLFNRINGSAPLFIENNFCEMTAIKYTKGEDYIMIQAYRHATPEDAFGMYASERSSGLENPPIGGECQADSENVYFFSGCIYVKMWGTSSEDISAALRKIAAQIADKVDPNAGYPAIMKAFPEDGKVPYSETYITSSYIGHKFLRSVYYVNYNRDGKSFQAFIIDGKSTEEAREIITRYLTFTEQRSEFTEGEMVLNDRYNGEIPIFWQGRYIVGIFSESGDTIPGASSLIREIVDNIL
jgi:hypothetical protein